MVHLTTIPHPDEGEKSQTDKDLAEVKRFHLQLAEDEDEFTTSVYGSKFAAADLPKVWHWSLHIPRDRSKLTWPPA